MTIDAEEIREFINKIGDAADAARGAGDQTAMNAADEALRRIGDGERPEVVYLECSGRTGRGAARADQRSLGSSGGGWQ